MSYKAGSPLRGHGRLSLENRRVVEQQIRGKVESGDGDDLIADRRGFTGREVNREDAQDLFEMFTHSDRRS